MSEKSDIADGYFALRQITVDGKGLDALLDDFVEARAKIERLKTQSMALPELIADALLADDETRTPGGRVLTEENYFSPWRQATGEALAKRWIVGVAKSAIAKQAAEKEPKP